MPYAREALAEARRAERDFAGYHIGRRPLHVVPLISIVGATVIGRPATQDGVYVLPVKQLVRHLRARGPLLQRDEIHALYAAARRSNTWTG